MAHFFPPQSLMSFYRVCEVICWKFPGCHFSSSSSWLKTNAIVTRRIHMNLSYSNNLCVDWITVFLKLFMGYSFPLIGNWRYCGVSSSHVGISPSTIETHTRKWVKMDGLNSEPSQNLTKHSTNLVPKSFGTSPAINLSHSFFIPSKSGGWGTVLAFKHQYNVVGSWAGPSLFGLGCTIGMSNARFTLS